VMPPIVKIEETTFSMHVFSVSSNAFIG